MFEDLVAKNILPDDKVLLNEIELACSLPDSFLTVVNFVKPAFEFVWPTCHAQTGYSMETYLQGGPEFVFSMTTQETSLSIIQNQTAFLAVAKVPGFDPRTIRIYEQPVDYRSGFGFEKRLITLGLPLTYTTDSDMAIGVAIHTEDKPEVVAKGKQWLTRIKERHNMVYNHAQLQSKQEPLQKVFVQRRLTQPLTVREEEMLKLMAKGLTSAQIADTLFISENTVETHRKNIFQKFEAKNMAELIKKASKLYWLE